MNAGIPDPGGVSGTFAALERTQPDANGMTTFAFEGHVIRALLIDDDPWFIAGDIARALGYRDAHNMGRRLDADEKATHSVSTPGGAQMVGIISEPGLYVAILGSQVEGARKFKRWIAREVLPMIRRTGSYDRYPASPASTALPSKRELAQWVIEAEDRAAAAEARAAELEPSAVAWDRLQEIGADYEVADAAKILSRDPNIEIGRNRLFEFMHDQDWIFRGRHNAWKAYQEQVDLGRLKHRPGAQYFCKKHDEYRTGDPTILITPKGLADLRRLLGGGPALVAVS